MVVTEQFQIHCCKSVNSQSVNGLKRPSTSQISARFPSHLLLLKDVAPSLQQGPRPVRPEMCLYKINEPTGDDSLSLILKF